MRRVVHVLLFGGSVERFRIDTFANGRWSYGMLLECTRREAYKWAGQKPPRGL